MEYGESFPEDPLTRRIKDAVRRFMTREIVRLSRLSPLGQTKSFTMYSSEAKDMSSPARNNIYLSAAACIAAKAARLLNEPAYLTIAERNLTWVLGRNYCGVSTMIDVGYKQQGVWSVMNTCKGHEDGALPGAVGKGLGAGRGTLRFYQPEILFKLPFRGICMPPDYPFTLLRTDRRYPTYHSDGRPEVWIKTQSDFILGCTEVASALEALGRLPHQPGPPSRGRTTEDTGEATDE